MENRRKELKFIVGDDTLLEVRNRISGIMRYDPHQSGDHYRVRSVYFDDSLRTCCRENAAGVSPRRKFRIRTYNCSEDLIRAEIKTNYRNTVSKMSTAIDRGTYDIFTSGSIAGITEALTKSADAKRAAGNDKSAHVLLQYLAAITSKNFAPACIVDYERCAYVYPVGGVRITFDRNITASDDFARMFDPALTGRCALHNNRHILEIKYDEFLPGEIRSLLAGLALQRTSCSKYVLCM